MKATPDEDTSNLMTYREAAHYLSVPLGQLYGWVHEKRVPHIRLGGRAVRFRRVALHAYLESLTVPAKAR